MWAYGQSGQWCRWFYIPPFRVSRARAIILAKLKTDLLKKGDGNSLISLTTPTKCRTHPHGWCNSPRGVVVFARAQSSAHGSWKSRLASGNAYGRFQERLDQSEAMQGDKAQRSALRQAGHGKIWPRGLRCARRIRCSIAHGTPEADAKISSLQIQMCRSAGDATALTPASIWNSIR